MGPFFFFSLLKILEALTPNPLGAQSLSYQGLESSQKMPPQSLKIN